MRRALPPITIGASLAGAVLSALLLGAHAGLAGVCGEAGAGCERVLASRWALLPSGTPVAAVGLCWFVSVFLWSVLVGPPGERREIVARALRWCAAAGLAVSVLFAAVMAVEVRAACPLCLGVHACSLALFLALWAPRQPRAADPDHPGERLAAATVALAAALSAAIWLGWRSRTLAERNAELEELLADASFVEARYLADARFTADEEARARFDRVVREDDPRIAASAGASSRAVVFLDVECPNCRELELLLREVVLPAFHGHLEVVWKHFPLQAHAHAEAGARALEAARAQEGFEVLREALMQRELAGVDWGEVARSVGLDGERVVADMEAEEIRARVREDVEAARSLGVEVVPAVFLDRREVDRFALGSAGFWKLRAEALRRERLARGEGW